MSNHPEDKTDSSQPMMYQIRIASHLDQQWVNWFESLAITLEGNGDTLLTCPVTDQAALFGLLKKIRDSGMQLISVSKVNSNEPHPSRKL